jgi:hypothetical protein
MNSRHRVVKTLAAALLAVGLTAGITAPLTGSPSADTGWGKTTSRIAPSDTGWGFN